jgi:glycerol-3-phosphate acyltransferase PlsY
VRGIWNTAAMIPTLIALLLAYLIGSIAGSLLLGRIVGVDIRTRGSGNAGGTNAFRTLGWRFALGVVAIDIGKGALAGAIGLASHTPDSPLSSQALAFACVGAAVLGHTWPVFFGFRGGKGAGTLVGGLLLLWPTSVPPLLAVWLLMLTATGYVGLATICAGFALVAVAWWHGARELADPRLVFALAAAAFLLFTHRANVSRLLAGEEHRFERARIWKRLFDARSGT